jgi:hypothetical protein
VLFENTPTVPMRASCVPLTGQAACTTAFGSSVLGGGTIGRGAVSCADRTGDVERGFGCAASTLTCGNGCCAGVCADGDDGADGGEEDSCAGAAGGDAGSFAGLVCVGGDGDCGAVCVGGD